MKRIPLIVFTFLIALLAVLCLAGGASAGPGSAGAPVFAPQAGAPATAGAASAGGVPAAVSYQGQVTVSGTPYTGAGYFKFAIIDATPISHWSNDGTSAAGGQPANAVQLTVADGLFNVLLGDTSLTNMTALPASAFAGTDRWLRVWFSSDNVTFTLLSPDRQIAAAPYALQAEEANNAGLLDGLAGSAYQARVGGTCAVGSTVRAVNPDGTVVCELDAPLRRSAAPQANISSAVDAAGRVGYDTSITIGADGLPVISYYDYINGDLKVLHCGNAACTAGNAITTVDAAEGVGWDTSITIGADGLPVVSYHDATNGDLKMLHCGNAACTAGNTAKTVDATGNVGDGTAITIGADGLPVISHYDSTNGDLKVLHCSNVFCTPYWRRR